MFWAKINKTERSSVVSIEIDEKGLQELSSTIGISLQLIILELSWRNLMTVVV